MKKNNCAMPARGMLWKAARPDFTEANGIPYAISPGNLSPLVVTICPNLIMLELIMSYNI
jgi:hypothetical protein